MTPSIRKLIRSLLGLIVSWVLSWSTVMESWQEWIIVVGKRCTGNRVDCSFKKIFKQSWFRRLGELREWSEAGVTAPRATTQTGLQLCIPSRKPLLNQGSRQKLKHLVHRVRFSKLSFQIKVYFAFYFEIPEYEQKWTTENKGCWKSNVKFSVSKDLGCHVIYWCWSAVFYQVQSRHLCTVNLFFINHRKYPNIYILKLDIYDL